MLMNDLESLEAGKQVFCEKPIAYDTKTVDEVYGLAEKKGLTLLCGALHLGSASRFFSYSSNYLTGFQRRHDNSFAKVKTLIDEGKIGKLHKIRTISRDNPCPPLAYLKISGGLIFDCSSYALHLALGMLASSC